MQVNTPVGTVVVPDTHAVGAQKKQFAKDIVPQKERLVVTVSWADDCNNGYKHLSVTAELREYGRLVSCGCLHDDIVKHFPELTDAVAFHLCAAKGPMYYFENTTNLAGDLDCWGYRKDEQHRSSKTGELQWYAPHPTLGYSVVVTSNEKPHPEATPWLQKGKERELEAARRCAVWPEASDTVLSLPKNELEAALAGRLPALMTRFKAVVEALGFVY